MKVLAGILAAALLLVSSLVYAGASWVLDGPVEIDFDRGFAKGQMTTARFSDNPDEFIGCAVGHRLLEGEPFSYAFCHANTSSGDYILCWTENNWLIDKIAELNHYSYVFFWWDEPEEGEDAECTGFRFSTQSTQIPGKDEMK